MTLSPAALIDGFLFRHALSAWGRAADAAAGMDPADLRPLRARAARLRRRLDRVIHAADGRLALPAGRAPALRWPLGADWAWRPEAFSGPLFPAGLAAVETAAAFGNELRVFHDCLRSETTLRQVRNTRPADVAPFGLRLDVFGFNGSFLSLALDLPAEAARGLGRRHLVRLEIAIETETPLEIFARLNVRHGPNVEQIVRTLPPGSGETALDFDLACTGLNAARVEAVWLDLIFERPQMTQITLRDVTLSRRPRAEL